MKSVFVILFSVAFACATAVRAETTVKLSNVHLCCKGCCTGVEEAAAAVEGAKIACDKEAGTVSVTAASTEVVQKAVDAIVAGGFFGQSSDPAVKVNSVSGAPDGKVTSATVSGLHLCCAKCAKAANGAALSVPGVQTSTAEKGVESFAVTGDFSAKDLAAALEKAGLSGKIK